MSDREKMIEAFRRVKALGWVESHRRNNTGIGKTFEDYVGVVENNLNEPDLYGYEIKSHREKSGSPVTLFTKSPTHPAKANGQLLEKYGQCSEDSPLKRLHTSMFATSFNNYVNTYSFKMVDKPEERRIYGSSDISSDAAIM